MTAVITGASSGIGLAAARALTKNGYAVICLSRTPCPEKSVKSIPCDITSQEQVRAAFEQIESIDLLINNAGFGISGSVEFTAAAQMKQQFELNFFAQVNVVKAALPKLKKSKGKILFISSAASVFSIPFQAFYSATKASVEMLSRALANELAQFGIQVCAVRLGDVKTGFTDARSKSFEGDDIYKGMIARSVAVMEKDERSGMPPEKIAEAIVKTAKRKKLPVLITVGTKYKLLCGVHRVLPEKTVNKIVGKLYMPKK